MSENKQAFLVGWEKLKKALLDNPACRNATGLAESELRELLDKIDELVRKNAESGRASAVLYVDGAARGNPGPAGAGIRLETEGGDRLAEEARFLGETTNNVAEYQALLHGLEIARNAGVRRLRIRTDSQLLARQLTGRYRVKNGSLVTLWSRAQELLGAFEDWRIEEVPREQNKDADRLANLAIDRAKAEGKL